MKDEYDYVVFDGAPVLPVTDSVVLSTHLDGVVLLARWDKTKTRETAKALEHLKAVGAPVLGTLLNHVRVKKGLYGYGYGYGYGNYRYAPEERIEEKTKS
jgi:receptor protein-tyrosine kinase